MKNKLSILLLLISSAAMAQMVKRPYVNGQIYGYLEYLPKTYVSNMPVIVFMHGIGEKGYGTSIDLDRLYRNGIPKLIKDGRWATLSKDRFIVVAPQNTNGFFNA